MLGVANIPPKIMPSKLGPRLPRIRTADLTGIVSIELARLFPDIPKEIYLRGDDLSAVRRAAENSLAEVDMSMIKPGDSVNLLCSEHGFSILEGWAYAEMLRTIHDVVREKTECQNIRLRFAAGGGLTEAREIIPYFKLDETFKGRIKATWPFDRGVAINTEIGTLYGLAKIYDGDWFIHAHYDDPRECYLHRLIQRPLKAFCMSYARYETRSVYHQNFLSRSSNIVPRAIFESSFVQNKHAFSCLLITSPAGVTNVDADNDLLKLNSRLSANTLRGYGKLLRLFAEIDECVAVLEDGRWPWYHHGGGLTSGNLFKAPIDYLDLTVGDRGNFTEEFKYLNPAVKALVINYSWRDFFSNLSTGYPVFIADRELAQGLSRRLTQDAVIAGNLSEALALAYKKSGTDKAIVFDGSYGYINLSPAMGEFLVDRASAVARKVDLELMPKWLKQRGIDPATV